MTMHLALVSAVALGGLVAPWSMRGASPPHVWWHRSPPASLSASEARPPSKARQPSKARRQSKPSKARQPLQLEDPAEEAAVDARQSPEALQHALSTARTLLEGLPERSLASDYTPVLRAFSDAGSPEECLGVLRRMRRLGLRPTLECYAFVVSALQTAGREREAATWMRRIVQPELSHSVLRRSVANGELVGREAYNRVLAAYAAAGRPAEAIDTMKQMVSQGGVTPDIVSFNCLIQSHATAGDPDRARAWLERAAQWGVSPDVITYTTVIAGFARAGRPDRAKEVLEQMMRMHAWHACMHGMHTCIHAYMHTCIHACMHTHRSSSRWCARA